jgi:hypothetical protein
MYTAVNLDEESKTKLVRHLIGYIPTGWEIIAHHMTINLGPVDKGPIKDRKFLGMSVEMEAEAIAASDKVIAVKIKTLIPSNNNIKHITVAVNRAGGGKPVMSNDLTDWQPMEPLTLFGTVEENSK